MPTLNDMFPSKYVTGADLQGREFVVTIARLEKVQMRPGGSAPVDRWVMHVKDGKKGVILSKALALAIAQALDSDNTDDWMGRQVVLFPVPMNVAGKSVIAIRAKAAPKQATEMAPHATQKAPEPTNGTQPPQNTTEPTTEPPEPTRVEPDPATGELQVDSKVLDDLAPKGPKDWETFWKVSVPGLGYPEEKAKAIATQAGSAIQAFEKLINSKAE